MNRDIKNILYINSSSCIYGAETRLLDIIKHLDSSKFRPFVLLPDSGIFEQRLKQLGVITLHLQYKFKISKSNPFWFFLLTRDFIRLVNRHKIKLIHINLHMQSSNFWLAFMILRIPVIVHLRSHFWIHVFEKFVMCRASKVICISRAVERAFLKKRRSSFFMFNRRNLTKIIYDGIDVKHFFPKPREGKIRKGLNIDSEDFLVGLIGALDRVKGQDVLIQAAEIIAQKYPNTKFVIIGDVYANSPTKIKYRTKIVNLIKDLGLAGKVIMTGFRSDIDIFMNEIDLLVQPSQREALGTSMVEAMLCGRPVIGTDVDGIPEVIGENEAGMLLNPRTPEALAEAIMFFIENPNERIKRGLKARERAIKMFNVCENIKQIESVYNEAMKQS